MSKASEVRHAGNTMISELTASNTRHQDMEAMFLSICATFLIEIAAQLAEMNEKR